MRLLPRLLVLYCCLLASPASAHLPDTATAIALDYTWLNGQPRQQDYPLTLLSKQTGEQLLVATVLVDAYYNYNFARPIDNTHVSSASIGRSNEVGVNQASFGVESHYRNAIGRLAIQFGQQAAIVQDLDASVAHGRNSSIINLKNIREAAAGYHFNKWQGINAEMGIFSSFVGMESYIMADNWAYQRAIVSDMTPFYFTGARIQAAITTRLRAELWLVNGWQSYSSYNSSPGIGAAVLWRPGTRAQIAANAYIAGQDNPNLPALKRYHHDHSIQYAYYRRPLARGITRAAFSLNNHAGFQSGSGIKPTAHHMLGTSLAHRLWFRADRCALTLRADYVTNPGLYLAFAPALITPNSFTNAVTANGGKLNTWQLSTTFDLMPSDNYTLRLEYGYRAANVPYFADAGGTTSPDGWLTTPVAPTWSPHLARQEHRLTLAVNFRL